MPVSYLVGILWNYFYSIWNRVHWDIDQFKFNHGKNGAKWSVKHNFSSMYLFMNIKVIYVIHEIGYYMAERLPRKENKRLFE